MTGSQRPDRDALIEAARTAAAARGWHTEWTTTAAMIDAVLPLIADAIERQVGRDIGDRSRGMRAAARLARTLAQPETGE